MKLNRSKLFFSIITTLFLLVEPVFSIEWGGIIKNDTKAQLAELKAFSFVQSDGVYLWANFPLGKSGLYFAGEGMYKYTLVIDDSNTSFSHFADLDLFKISGDYELENGTFSVSAGRFMMMDSTSAIFAQNCDGLAVKYSGSRIGLSAFGGYTGLLNSQNVSMLDKDGYVLFTDQKIYTLANPIVPVSATVEFPAMFGNQSLSLQCYAFFDLGADKYNRYYGTLLLSGPFSNKLFYSVASSIGTSDFSKLMNYSVLNLYVYPNDFMTISLGTEYASGKNGIFNPFNGVTSRSVVNSMSAPETSGVIVPNIACSVVFDKIYLGLNGKFLMGIPENKIEVKGIEADVSFVYSVFTDFQIGFDVSSYIDISKNNDDNLSATLRVAISF